MLKLNLDASSRSGRLISRFRYIEQIDIAGGSSFQAKSGGIIRAVQ